MFARAGACRFLRSFPTRHSSVGFLCASSRAFLVVHMRFLSVLSWVRDMVGGAGAVRRSARLTAAVASENPEKPVAQRVTKRSSQTKSDVKEENEEYVGSVSGAQTKPIKSLRRTKSFKKFPSRDLETKLWELGFRNVAGVDEAGRGPLAGPVVAAACIIPASVTIPGVDDSKKLTETQREEVYAQIISTPGVLYAIHVVDAAKIDEINILQATLLAMSTCVVNLKAEKGQAPDYVLVDGNRLPADLSKEEAQFVIKGDAECHVIAAASILAKVTRDRMMLDYDKKWPEYGFKAHKGYGTASHMAALLKHGPCDIHRRSFAPLKDRILQIEL